MGKLTIDDEIQEMVRKTQIVYNQGCKEIEEIESLSDDKDILRFIAKRLISIENELKTLNIHNHG